MGRVVAATSRAVEGMKMEPKASLQAMRCRKCGNRSFFTSILPAPVEEAVAVMMKARCAHCGAGVRSLTIGEGRTLEEDRVTRQSWASERLRAANWILQGELGASSKSIHAFMTGVEDHAGHVAPADLDDMRRCILLMHHVPEWLDRIPSMTSVPQWANIAPIFHIIQETYLGESPNLDGRAPLAARILEMHKS
jgi:ribosomal protein L37E